MAAGDLTTVSNVKAWLGKTDANADALLGTLVSDASAAIAVYCSVGFADGVVAFNDVRRGGGGDTMVMRVRPVVSVTSLAIDQRVIPAQPADGQPGYFLVDDATLALFGYRFTRGNGFNVRVQYTAGFAAVPADVAQCAVEWVADSYARGSRKDPSLESKGVAVGGERQTFKLVEMPASIKGKLDRRSNLVPL